MRTNYRDFKKTKLDEMEVFFGLRLLQSRSLFKLVKQLIILPSNCESVAINGRLSKDFNFLKLVNGSFQVAYKA